MSRGCYTYPIIIMLYTLLLVITIKITKFAKSKLIYNTYMKKNISNGEVESLSNAPSYTFPKYTTQIINLVNGNAQGTRPDVVGQMSDLIQEFDGKSIEEWIKWYTARMPNAVNDATEKVYNMFLQMKDAAELIDKEKIRNWVKDLVYTKTYCGLKFQEAIISYLAKQQNVDYRLANPEEEALGIDGFIGTQPVSIKPSTYDSKEMILPEHIDVPIITYEKKKGYIQIVYPDDLFESQQPQLF